eukprot:3932258-Rhodomonas_salina.2
MSIGAMSVPDTATGHGIARAQANSAICYVSTGHRVARAWGDTGSPPPRPRPSLPSPSPACSLHTLAQYRIPLALYASSVPHTGSPIC